MKYYSDLLNKMFDTEVECQEAEQEEIKAKQERELEKQRKEEQRKIDKAAVDAASEQLKSALKTYCEAITNYNKKYNSDRFEPIKFKWNFF